MSEGNLSTQWVKDVGTADWVKSVRKITGLTQHNFCDTYGLHLSSLRNWEQANRHPDQAATTYLSLIEKYPQLVHDMLHSSKS